MEPLPLPDIMAADKIITQPLAWAEIPKDRLSMVLSLDIDGVTIEGLRFRFAAMKRHPDKFLTAQLEYAPPKGSVLGGAMARIEWRPLTAHTNKGVGPPHLRFVPQGMTHHHRFDLNWAHSQAIVRRGGLPISVPIDPDPATFDDFVDLVRTEFRIPNLGSVPIPPWEQVLV